MGQPIAGSNPALSATPSRRSRRDRLRDPRPRSGQMPAVVAFGRMRHPNWPDSSHDTSRPGRERQLDPALTFPPSTEHGVASGSGLHSRRARRQVARSSGGLNLAILAPRRVRMRRTRSGRRRDRLRDPVPAPKRRTAIASALDASSPNDSGRSRGWATAVGGAVGTSMTRAKAAQPARPPGWFRRCDGFARSGVGRAAPSIGPARNGGGASEKAGLVCFRGRARRGTSGALYLQSAPAGLNPLPRSPILTAAIRATSRTGSRAAATREPCQVRKEAALSDQRRVPRNGLV
jgi:hypothetical protein